MKILLIVLVIAVVVYALARSVEKAVARRRRGQVSGPVAPDDDLDFLRNLEWEQRKDRQRRRKADGASDQGDDETRDPENDETPGDDTSS